MKDERLGPIGDERYLRYARDIHESARHALLVVERILGAPMTDSHVTDLSFTNLDLNDVIKALDKHRAFLRGEIARKVNLKFAPDVRFKIDDSFDNSAKIDALLNSEKVRRDLDQASGDEADDQDNEGA